MITPKAAPALLHPLTGVSRSCLSPVRNDFADPLGRYPAQPGFGHATGQRWEFTNMPIR